MNCRRCDMDMRTLKVFDREICSHCGHDNSKWDLLDWAWAMSIVIILAIAGFFFSVIKLHAQTQPKVTITWDASIDGPDAHVAGYLVKRTTAPVSANSSYIDICLNDSPTNLECTDNSIDGSTAYAYIVAAFEQEYLPIYRFGDFSDPPFTFSFTQIQPNTPGGIVSTAANSTTPGRAAVTISWGNVTAYRNTQPIPATAVKTYRLFQSSTETSPGTFVTSVTGLSFTVQGLKKHSSYYFYVTCVVDGVESFGSAAIRVQT